MSEFEPPVLNPVRKEGGETNDRKPFVIRGHHLNIYALLVTRWYGPSELVKGIRLRIEKE